MEAHKILAALIENPGIGARQLATLSGAKQNTVESVLQRHRQALIQTSAPARGRGRPTQLYQVKEEWVPILQRRAAEAEPPKPTDALERAIRILEAAALAANDREEPEAERERMADLARRRASAAIALLGVADELGRDPARARIERALRVADIDLSPVTLGARPDPIAAWEDWARPTGPLHGAASSLEHPPYALGVWWRHWSHRLWSFAEQYGARISGDPEREFGGLGFVIDCVPGDRRAITREIMEPVLEEHGPTVSVRLVDLRPELQDAFIDGFAQLALDPIARFAKLYVALDSDESESLLAWQKVALVAQANRLPRALGIAGSSLGETILACAEDDLPPAIAYHQSFVDVAVARAKTDRTIWPVFGRPRALDVGHDERFPIIAERIAWERHEMQGAEAVVEAFAAA